MTHTPAHEFFRGDAEMRPSSATLSEFAFEMEMEGAEPIVPEPALQQRTEAPSAHSSILLTSWTTSPVSAPSRVRAAGAPSHTTWTGEARAGASPFAQRGRSPGRTPMPTMQPLGPSMMIMRALHPRNEREHRAHSIRGPRSPP
jgi:hypothetical protein